jgi:hypothetical protein
MSPSPLTALEALYQLGAEPVALNALYKFGLATGHYRRVTAAAAARKRSPAGLQPLFPLPDPRELARLLGSDGLHALRAEADEIVGGRVRLFGADSVPLRLNVPGELADWTAYETGRAVYPLDGLPARDVKFLWEPARFGWAFTLGRAYHLTKDEKYAGAFWTHFEEFANANPPYRGPHWTSAQEAALRLMALAWAGQVFASAAPSTPERLARLAAAVAAHAARIPPTLPYARSQQNNHLLSEAAGLLTAGLALPDLPEADGWRRLGWKWLNQGLQDQIDGYGEYAQHSTNYHRLMLQLVLWTGALLRSERGRSYRWPRKTVDALTRSIHWLLALLDDGSGRVPNLGANDGAYIFPLTVQPFADHRPVLYAAARAFLDYRLPSGPWDELALWCGLPLEDPHYVQLPRYIGDQVYGVDSWACLRTAQFETRPSHADQLHLDLWWRGLNVAQDAGTYLYNADPPWDNALTTARVHNTLTVDDLDQMPRAGRFLYLGWFNAYRQPGLDADPLVLQRLRGRYRNYREGYRHTRTVAALADRRWQVRDELMPLRFPGASFLPHPHSCRLHWLLPDWKWKLDETASGAVLRLDSPHGPLRLTVSHSPVSAPARVSLVRAGELLAGSGTPEPIRGWASPTYGVKLPALSLAVELASANDVQFLSEFALP